MFDWIHTWIARFFGRTLPKDNSPDATLEADLTGDPPSEEEMLRANRRLELEEDADG
jgi:hypothetical protein